MKERRMARRCKNCGESMPSDALLCAACGSVTSEIYSRLTDPHQAGEPFLLCDRLGWFMQCPTCETKVRWKDDEPAEFGLGDAPTLA